MLSALPPILEEAVVESCEKELERLLENTDKNTAGTLIEEALEELAKLSQETRTKPNYTHPWVPLLHASWYHLRHVKFCLNTVKKLIEEPVRSGEPIGILDFGCGTMPLQWAAAVAIATMAIKDNLSIPAIRIVNIDESEPMSDLGCDMWEDMQTVVEQKQKTRREIRPLHSVMQKMWVTRRVNPAENPSSGFSANDKLQLITVIHAVYTDAGKLYREYIKPLIKDRPTPKILFTANSEHWFTTHNTMQKKFMPVQMDPTWSSIVEEDLNVEQDLKRLTGFRHRMYSDFCQSNIGGRAKTFLCKKDVKWQEHNKPPIGFIMTAR